MFAPTRICCATDLSEAADEALRQADLLAKAFSAELFVLHVVPVLKNHPLFPHFHARTLAELPTLLGQCAEVVNARVTEVTGRRSGEYDIEVHDGAPYATIIERAEAAQADLIVVGSHGTTGIRRLLLGSVAERVVRYAHVPVLVARLNPGGRILAATDLSHASLPAVEAAADIARQRKASVAVLHSVDLPAIPFVAGGEVGYLEAPISPSRRADMLGRADDTLAEALESRGIEAERIIVDGSPAVEILRAADGAPTDIVVVCTTGRTGLARLFLGSVAETVVRHAPCSVMVVPSVSPSAD